MILKVNSITKSFSVEKGVMLKEIGRVFALNDVSFEVKEESTLGIVGESGSGKTTLAKIILKLIKPDKGQIDFDEELIKNFHKDVQIVFQNPYNSLNPKMKIKDMLIEPLVIHKKVKGQKAMIMMKELLAMVGLPQSCLNRFPFEFSGGQRQRICIARALASQPRFVILDEPVSSLDLTVQLEILDLFKKLKNDLSLTYIFISHNLAVIKYIADELIVMKNGMIVERGNCTKLLQNPQNPYTLRLLNSARG